MSQSLLYTQKNKKSTLILDFFRNFTYNIHMKMKLIVLGKIKEACLKGGIAEYAKRLSRFCDLKIIELADEKIPDNPSEAECRAVLEKEGEKILKQIAPNDYVISLCVEGKQMPSEAFAETIEKIGSAGFGSVAIVIGGSLGLSERVKSASRLKLSFSKMTFPHQLMRLILTEQLYRAFKIINHETYHK